MLVMIPFWADMGHDNISLRVVLKRTRTIHTDELVLATAVRNIAILSVISDPRISINTFENGCELHKSKLVIAKSITH